MIYHAVTPLSRPENFAILKELLKPTGIVWEVVVDHPPRFEIPSSEDWIRVHSVDNLESGWKAWRKCINWFASHGPIVLKDRYLILADDCTYEDGFFEKVDRHPEDVVIVSMKRGDQTPPGTPPDRAHGTNTLVAAPENMHPCHVSAEQIVMAGHLFRRINLIVHSASDGYMVESMVHDNPTGYEPDAFVRFNYLEPGRWNK